MFAAAIVASAGAQSPSKQDVAPSPPAISAAAASAAAPNDDARLVVFNREIAVFRSALLGVSAADRARRAQPRIEELLKLAGPQAVTTQASPLGMLIQVDGATAFAIAPQDADPLL